MFHTPVGYVDVYDAGFQEFSVQISAGSQDPALVMRQTVSNKQNVVFLGRLPKSLPKFSLLVFNRCENEWRCVQTQTLRPLQTGGFQDLGHSSDRNWTCFRKTLFLSLALEYMSLISKSAKFPFVVIPYHSSVFYLYASC